MDLQVEDCLPPLTLAFDGQQGGWAGRSGPDGRARGRPSACPPTERLRHPPSAADLAHDTPSSFSSPSLLLDELSPLILLRTLLVLPLLPFSQSASSIFTSPNLKRLSRTTGLLRWRKVSGHAASIAWRKGPALSSTTGTSLPASSTVIPESRRTVSARSRSALFAERIGLTIGCPRRAASATRLIVLSISRSRPRSGSSRPRPATLTRLRCIAKC